MDDSPNLVSTYTFKDKEYLVKMYVLNANTLELSVTDKHTAEEWRCSYDATYIENLSHKTGNYKQFDVFVTMLKSGLLKTSDCVSLDLLTVDDLEGLRSRRVSGKMACGLPRQAMPRAVDMANRRYLILTYTVEFDRIHYPLPLEYCGPPDPQVLQGIIRKLESEVERLQEQLHSDASNKGHKEEISRLQKRVDELTLENKALVEDVRELNRRLSHRASSYQQMENMQAVMKGIEEQVVQERTSFQRLLHRLRDEKTRLQMQVDQLRLSENNLRTRLRGAGLLPHALHPVGSQQPLTARTVVRGPASVASTAAAAVRIGARGFCMGSGTGPSQGPSQARAPAHVVGQSDCIGIGPGPGAMDARAGPVRRPLHTSQSAGNCRQSVAFAPATLCGSGCSPRRSIGSQQCRQPPTSKSIPCCHKHLHTRSNSDSSHGSRRRASTRGRKASGDVSASPPRRCERSAARGSSREAVGAAQAEAGTRSGTRPGTRTGIRPATAPTRLRQLSPGHSHRREVEPRSSRPRSRPRPRRSRRSVSDRSASASHSASASGCSSTRSCCCRRRRHTTSGDSPSSTSSSRVVSGSGDRSRNVSPSRQVKSQKPSKGIKSGMSELEERIKALQKLLKQGLPVK